MFDAITEQIENGRGTKYRIMCNGSPVAYSKVLDLWANDATFRAYFTMLLKDSPFTAYRWETPTLSRSTVDRPFEFVLLNSPGFYSRQTDFKTYDDYFTDDDTDQGIVTFGNLRGDATLIVPSPRTTEDAYGHLAAFVRLADDSQVDALWQVVGSTVQEKISDKPMWLSTAGGGVAWLHIRIDARPKYYGHSAYKDVV